MSLGADREGAGGGQGQLLSDLPIDSVDALQLGGKEEQQTAGCLHWARPALHCTDAFGGPVPTAALTDGKEVHLPDSKVIAKQAKDGLIH
ncbi:MAG: hypothetical protein FRX49_05837 [Trebouxia sp. A1-2]|nr:MAG: hypothetical protein FRX49_05837 [Trebouxia sp. A1-2]